jgi:hypothetical protein
MNQLPVAVVTGEWVWLATSSDANQSGGFYRDRQIIDW